MSQIHRGLHGVAYTVFQGTEPEAMQLEILGVLHDAIGPGQDMILARLLGTKPEYTGVVAGMSGSPVYIDGKLVGALSYRIGQFSKEPIAGITPIELMMEVKRDADTPSAAVPSSADAESAPPAGLETQTASPTSTGFQLPNIQPIETPLVFDGFSPQTLQLFGNRFTAMGLQPVAGLGGASPETSQPEPIVPGSAISAILVRGDLSIAATCTVTYVDPKQLLACGHPITQFGSVSMPMTKADVVATLASPLNSFKIINTTQTIGSFTQDRMTAILGRFGQQAKMIPVVVTVRPSDGDPGKPRTLHFEVLNNPSLTPQAMLVSIYQSLKSTNTSGEELSYRMSGQMEIAGHAPVRMDAMISPTDQLPASLGVALFINERFSRIYNNPLQQPDIRSFHLTFDALPQRRSATLESARLSTTEAHAGDVITVEATVQPYHGAARILRIPVTLPDTLTPGKVRFLVGDATSLDRLMLPPAYESQHPLSLDGSIAQLNREHDNAWLYVTLLEHAPQAVLAGEALPSLPLSMANILQSLRDTRQLSLAGESALPLGSSSVEDSLSGSQVLTLDIR
ncbi:MAG: SpoIVB peptidase S55 [Acidobacteriaceae bacterium]